MQEYWVHLSLFWPPLPGAFALPPFAAPGSDDETANPAHIAGESLHCMPFATLPVETLHVLAIGVHMPGPAQSCESMHKNLHYIKIWTIFFIKFIEDSTLYGRHGS
jgi:hypothetical protein